MRVWFKATHVALATLDVMYRITCLDRATISTAVSEVQKEPGLTNIRLGRPAFAGSGLR